MRVSNHDSGIRALLTQLKVPSAGSGHLGISGWLGVAGSIAVVVLDYPVVVLHARQSRNFAKATNQLVKTDQVDAALLAWFAAATSPLCQ